MLASSSVGHMHHCVRALLVKPEGLWNASGHHHHHCALCGSEGLGPSFWCALKPASILQLNASNAKNVCSICAATAMPNPSIPSYTNPVECSALVLALGGLAAARCDGAFQAKPTFPLVFRTDGETSTGFGAAILAADIASKL